MLTTVARVTADTGLSGVTSNAILAASALVTGFLGYELARETVVETLQGSDRFRIVLSRTPIVSVSAVTYDGADIASEAAIEDRATGFLFRQSGWPSAAFLAPGASPFPHPDRGELPISVTYVGGYYLPSFTSASTSGVTDVTLPTWAEAATIELAKALHLRRGDAGGAVTEEATPDYRVKYAEAKTVGASSVAALSSIAEALLAPHVRMA